MTRTIDTLTAQDAYDLAQLVAKMDDDSYVFPDADAYYRAKRDGMKSWRHDPAGYAFDMQSN